MEVIRNALFWRRSLTPSPVSKTSLWDITVTGLLIFVVFAWCMNDLATDLQSGDRTEAVFDVTSNFVIFVLVALRIWRGTPDD